jgi:hypothetical protein
VADLKSLNGIGDAGISFNTVVVDEAARANPLDLFIPMSMAERRVVLVGDHRQLPHLLEPAVEEAVAEAHDLSDEQRKAYEESLFQRLWRQLKEREKRDGFRGGHAGHPVPDASCTRRLRESRVLRRKTRPGEVGAPCLQLSFEHSLDTRNGFAAGSTCLGRTGTAGSPDRASQLAPKV